MRIALFWSDAVNLDKLSASHFPTAFSVLLLLHIETMDDKYGIVYSIFFWQVDVVVDVEFFKLNHVVVTVIIRAWEISSRGMCSSLRTITTPCGSVEPDFRVNMSLFLFLS